MNKKGFIFIETIIVIAILLSSLMLIYSLYANSVSSENIRLRYDDPAKLYETFYVRKYLESFDLDVLKQRIADGEPYQMIYRSQSDIFGNSYANERNFFENIWMNLHIQTILVSPGQLWSNGHGNSACRSHLMKPWFFSACMSPEDMASLSFLVYRMSVNICARVSLLLMRTNSLFSSRDSFSA